jgi:hypothetical protein
MYRYMIETIAMVAPAKREKKARLTEELRGMVVDGNKGYRLDNRTANCLRQYGRFKGWVVVGFKDGPEHQMLWRVG